MKLPPCLWYSSIVLPTCLLVWMSRQKVCCRREMTVIMDNPIWQIPHGSALATVWWLCLEFTVMMVIVTAFFQPSGYPSSAYPFLWESLLVSLGDRCSVLLRLSLASWLSFFWSLLSGFYHLQLVTSCCSLVTAWMNLFLSQPSLGSHKLCC